MDWEKGEISIFHGVLAEELSELGVYLMMVCLVSNCLELLNKTVCK